MNVAARARDYSAVLARVPRTGSRDDRMRALVDILWEVLHPTGVSWIGFYISGPDPAEMTLGHRRDKPACSPIGLHGACGRCLLSRRSLVVTDVATLGANYVACDPRDRSEVVLPLLDEEGACYAVLDADSYEVASFGAVDARELDRILVAAGLCCSSPRAGDPDVI